MPNPWMDAAHAARWAAQLKGGNPFRDRQIGVICRLAEAVGPRRVLDLGVGTGAVVRRLLPRLPGASFVGLDGSPTMLERARFALEAFKDRITFLESRLEADWPKRTGTDFDLVVAVQTIHHLAGEAKRDCYAKVWEVLKPGGCFLVSDRLAIDLRFFALYRTMWDRARDHADFERLSDAFTEEAYQERLAQNGDVPDRLETQLAWLRDVGFDPVDCFWLDADRAVFGGFKPEA